MPQVLAEQGRRHWERFALDTLPGKTLGVVGSDQVGRAIARVARGAGLRVVAVRRTAGAADPALPTSTSSIRRPASEPS